MLEILDPRSYTESVARLKIVYGLSLVAAELFAAAISTGADIHVAQGNVGRSWEAVLADTPVNLYVYARHGLE
ncbi:MAG: hypothetical protein OXG67_09860 [bacterium]|nr:hypothetical protein [bacterium]MCY3888761.1 hypothetical protein [bacterium]